MPYNTLVVLTGISLLGLCSGLVGSFAVLRRRALMGDALAHAALPGVCLAFLILGQRHLPGMLLGGFLTGILGITLVSALRYWTRIKEDAAIGIVLSVFYGAGIALSSWIQSLPTIGSKAGLDSYFLGKTSGMLLEDIYLIGGVALLCLVMILLMYKEFKLVAFDPAFADVQGWPTFQLDLLLMAMIALTVIIGLPAVGVVLMAALLIIPAAAARFWTERLGAMLVLSAGFGLVTGALGTLVSAAQDDLPSGPVIVLVGTTIFLCSMLFAPRRGLIARVWGDYQYRRKIADQTVLRVLYETCEPDLPQLLPVRVNEILKKKGWRRNQIPAVINRLQKMGYVDRNSQEAGILLTNSGLNRSTEIILAHRMWELFLTEHAETACNFADLDSESLKERLPRELIDELESQLKSDGLFPQMSQAGQGGDPA
jgi:manganese/zinc/iron transport system permease protein